MIEDHAATQWLLRHPAAAAGLGSAAIFGLSSRARDGVLSVLGRCYLFVYPPDRSPIALHTEKTERPIPLPGNSRFAQHPKELRRVAKERGVTVAQLLQDAVNDCSIQPKEGELVNCWDLLTVWGSDNLNSEQLESWRQVSDEPSDVALLDLEKERPVRPDEDVIERIRKTAETEPGARELWQQISARPPPDCGALSKEWYDARRGSPASIEEELSAEAIVLKRGQEVFWKYYAAMLVSQAPSSSELHALTGFLWQTVLLHHSLAGGFASPRIVRVLEQTGYLLPKSTMESGKNLSQASADRSWVRLLETTQWVLDVMEHGVETLMPPSEAQPEGGQGWRSTVRVRMLHAKVRRRIMKNAAALEGRYDVAADGIPINQEDLAATLGSFSVSPLLSLLRLGLQPTLQEREDFVALWRHIGYYMGVSPDILTRHYSSAKVADQFLFSVVRHMFSELETTLRRGEQPPPGATMPLLTAVSKRKPFFTPLEAHCGISR